jgi:hypothetical protein
MATGKPPPVEKAGEAVVDGIDDINAQGVAAS